VTGAPETFSVLFWCLPTGELRAGYRQSKTCYTAEGWAHSSVSNTKRWLHRPSLIIHTVWSMRQGLLHLWRYLPQLEAQFP
jgi:hypothetical protein